MSNSQKLLDIMDGNQFPTLERLDPVSRNYAIFRTIEGMSPKAAMTQVALIEKKDWSYDQILSNSKKAEYSKLVKDAMDELSEVKRDKLGRDILRVADHSITKIEDIHSELQEEEEKLKNELRLLDEELVMVDKALSEMRMVAGDDGEVLAMAMGSKAYGNVFYQREKIDKAKDNKTKLLNDIAKTKIKAHEVFLKSNSDVVKNTDTSTVDGITLAIQVNGDNQQVNLISPENDQKKKRAAKI